MNRIIAVMLALIALVPAYASQTVPVFVNSTKSEQDWLGFKKRFLDKPDGSSLYVNGTFPAAILGPAACQVMGVNRGIISDSQLPECAEAFANENGIDPDARLTKEAFMARGQGARYYVPRLLAQAPAAPGGAAANGGVGAMPAPAAAPAAPAPDPAVAEMKRQLDALKTARQSEASALAASNNALSGRIDGVGQQATAAARAASAVQETTRRLGGRVDSVERGVSTANGVAAGAQAQAASAASKAESADRNAAVANETAASAAGLAALSWSKALEVEETLKTVTLKVNQIDWRPFAAVGALALIGVLTFLLLRGQMKSLKTVATDAKAKAEAVMTEIEGVQAAVVRNTSDIATLRTDVRAVRDIAEGQPGFTQLAEGTAMFYQRLTLLGPNTHPTMACEVLVTNEDGFKQSYNINITAVGNDQYTVEGVRDQGGNALAFEGLDKKILRAGRQGRIVGCKPFVPPVGSPSNGPKTVGDAAKPSAATSHRRAAARAALEEVPPFLRSKPDPGLAAVAAVAATVATGDQFPQTESVPLATMPGELLPGLQPRPPASQPDFNADHMMVATPDQSAANIALPTATGTAGS